MKRRHARQPARGQTPANSGVECSAVRSSGGFGIRLRPDGRGCVISGLAAGSSLAGRLAAGSVITSVNGAAVADAKAFGAALKAAPLGSVVRFGARLAEHAVGGSPPPGVERAWRESPAWRTVPDGDASEAAVLPERRLARAYAGGLIAAAIEGVIHQAAQLLGG